MEITLLYQDRQITLSKPETKYGSNLDSFSELVNLAFLGVGLYLDGKIEELKDDGQPE